MTILIKLLISLGACSLSLAQNASSAQSSGSTSDNSSAALASSGDSSVASTSASDSATSSAASQSPSSQAASPSSTAESESAATTLQNSGTDDLGWIQTISPAVLTPIPTTNADKITPTGKLPLATSSVNFNGDYSDSRLEQLWDDWVGPVQQPPLTEVPHPPSPYPQPIPPPPLYPSEYTNCPKDILPGYKFPSDFLFGFATSAQQWEGAVKTDGKGPSVWDWASRYPGFIADNTTSDVTDLGYYLYEEDLARLAALGANAYSFSIFWSRILPFGMQDSPVNQAGLDYYKQLIDYAWSQNVEPVVTLYHWDTPLAMQLEYGGWASERIIDDFVNYAETVFRAYNGSVNKWITFNEPAEVCGQILPPINSTLPGNLSDPMLYRYTCSYHLTLAHARTYHLFKDLGITGQIAIKSDGYVGVPWREGNANDTEAVKRHEAYAIGLFAEPIYLSGDWPELIKADLGPEILPRFNQSQMEYINGTADFFALDGYRNGFVSAPSNGIEACRTNKSDPGFPGCNLSYDYDSSPAAWAIGPLADPSVSWLQNTWSQLKDNIVYLTEKYPTQGGFYLSEYGFAEPGENAKTSIYQITEDPSRTAYMMSYLTEVLKMICDDGLPVKGTFAWSIVDNFEWNNGYASRFGVQYVDYDSPTLERTFKRSALEMSQFWNAHRCDQ